MTPDGYEQTYQVNFLAPFLLTTQLMDVLLESRATVVNTTSSSHKLVFRATVDDLENTAKRRPSTAYALTKLAIVLFTRELHRRHHAGGLSVATVHPGYVNSNFGHASGSRFLVFVQRHTPSELYTSTADEGADQLVWLASSTPGVDWTPGEYYSKHKIAKASRLANNPRLAAELWDRTLARWSGSGETRARRTPLGDLHRRCPTFASILARRPGLVPAVRPHLHRRLARTVRRQGRSAAVDLPGRSAITRQRDRRTGAVAGCRRGAARTFGAPARILPALPAARRRRDAVRLGRIGFRRRRTAHQHAGPGRQDVSRWRSSPPRTACLSS